MKHQPEIDFVQPCVLRELAAITFYASGVLNEGEELIGDERHFCISVLRCCRRRFATVTAVFLPDAWKSRNDQGK